MTRDFTRHFAPGWRERLARIGDDVREEARRTNTSICYTEPGSTTIIHEWPADFRKRALLPRDGGEPVPIAPRKPG